MSGITANPSSGLRSAIHGNSTNNIRHLQVLHDPVINEFPLYWTILRFRQAAHEIRTRENTTEAMRNATDAYELWKQMVCNLLRDIGPFNTAAEYLEYEANQVWERGLTAWIRDDSSPANQLPLVEGPYSSSLSSTSSPTGAEQVLPNDRQADGRS